MEEARHPGSPFPLPTAGDPVPRHGRDRLARRLGGHQQGHPAHPPREREAPQRNGEEDDGRGCGESPVHELRDLGLDQHGDHRVPQAAEHGGRDVEAERDQEHEHAAAPHPGQAQGEEHAEERAQGPGAQRLGRPRQRAVDAHHDAVERQDHQRQQHVHHADVHADGTVEQLQRRVDEPGLEQERVDDSLRTEQHHPRVGPDQEARQIRHDDQQQEEPPPSPADAQQDVRGRVPEEEAAEGDGEAHAEGAREDLQISRLREEVGIVGEAPARGLDAHEQEPHQREGVEDEQEHYGGKNQQSDGALPPRGGRLLQGPQGRASSRTRGARPGRRGGDYWTVHLFQRSMISSRLLLPPGPVSAYQSSLRWNCFLRFAG